MSSEETKGGRRGQNEGDMLKKSGDSFGARKCQRRRAVGSDSQMLSQSLSPEKAACDRWG